MQRGVIVYELSYVPYVGRIKWGSQSSKMRGALLKNVVVFRVSFTLKDFPEKGGDTP